MVHSYLKRSDLSLALLGTADIERQGCYGAASSRCEPPQIAVQLRCLSTARRMTWTRADELATIEGAHFCELDQRADRQGVQYLHRCGVLG
jgi:hypothetical protein